MRRIHFKKMGCILPVLALLLALPGCTGTDSAGGAGQTESDVISQTGEDAVSQSETESGAGVENDEQPAPDLKTYSWEEAAVYEAEEGTLLGGTSTQEKDGVGYVEGFAKEGDGLELSIHIEETGFYDLNFVSRSADGGYKENYVAVDGERMGTAKVEGKTYTDSLISRVYLETGDHTVQLSSYWGWVQVDSLKVKPSDDLDPRRFDIEPVLVNPNATDNTRRLMAYLCDIYGKDILSGQFCDSGMFGAENATIWKTTGGKYPAILGLDMSNYTPVSVAHGAEGYATDYALECWERGGIVTFCWHWTTPEKYITGNWYSTFYKEHTNINLSRIMGGKDQEGYDLLVADIDAIAEQLLILQEADVPVLWRPLHEAGGGWFWWGNSGPEAYKQLYILMYDRLVNHHGLNNLIWVWNGQDKEWYPGDEYVDIIGEDIYPGERVYTPQTSKYLEVLEYTDARKMIILSENGCLFDPDLAIRDGSMWGSFCTWGGEFVTKNKQLLLLSEQYTEEDMLKRVYEHEHVITRDELPDLKNYPLPGQ